MDRKLPRAVVALALWSTGASADCNIVPPPDTPLATEGFYADRRGSVVDPTRKAARDKVVAIYETALRRVQASADAFATRADAAAGKCALRHLDAWAAAGPLTGRLATPQANYERNWYLAGFALAYLKVRAGAEAGARTRIETWLVAMAQGTLAALDAGEVPANNLLYWSGLGLAAAGLATTSKPLADRAQTILRTGLAAIGPDGTLPLETGRGSKALDYHVFAAAPLTLLAFMAETGRQPFDRAALKRLGTGILAGLEDPAPFAVAAGEPQERPADWTLAWLPVYRALVPGGELPMHSQASHFLGGDVQSTMNAIRAVLAR